MKLDDNSKAWLTSVHQDATKKVETVRARQDLTAEAKRAAVAKIHRETKTTVKAAEARLMEQTATATKTNSAKLWGITDLTTGPRAMDFASAASSYRDAGDRAAKIERPEEAAALMQRAEQTGDEFLARAVAARCYSERGPFGAAWQGPLDQYLSARPAKAQVAQALQESEGVPFTDMAYFSVAAPREVEGLSDAQLNAVADNPHMQAAS
jgi:hypothetical protein